MYINSLIVRYNDDMRVVLILFLGCRGLSSHNHSLRTSRPRKSSKHKCLPLTAGIHFFNETAVNPLPLGMGWLSVENNKEDGAGMDPAPSVFCQSIFSIQMIAERSIVSR